MKHNKQQFVIWKICAELDIVWNNKVLNML